MEFLLEKDAIGRIPKTIVYIDSKGDLVRCRRFLVKVLLGMGYTHEEAAATVCKYDTDVRPTDQDRIYSSFRLESSRCRVILATIALGMGMDIPDVQRVVQFGEVRSKDVPDVWQRFGRAARGGGHGVAYFFAPYWYFDRLGVPEPNKEREVPIRPALSQSYTTPGPSRLRFASTNDDIERDDDTDSDVSYTSSIFMPTDLIDLIPSQVTADKDHYTFRSNQHLGLFGDIVPMKWGKRELNSRRKLADEYPEMYSFANATCFRRAALTILQDSNPDPVTGPQCCNACCHILGDLPPLRSKVMSDRAPNKNTRAWFIIQELRLYGARMAQKLYPDVPRLFDFPSEAFFYR